MQEVTFLRTMAAAFLASLLGVLLLLRVGWGIRPHRLLTPREWVIFARIVGTLGMGLLLLLRWATQDLPPALFIYGRF
jgi:hypothetical protein